MRAPSSTSEHGTSAEDARARVPVWGFLGAVALLSLLWALDRWVFQLSVLTTFRGTRAASPLYAFWIPNVRVEAVAFLVLAAAFLVFAPRLGDPKRTPRVHFCAALALAAVTLPLALFLVRQDLGELGAPFRIYQNEEFWDDALKIPLMRDASGRTGTSVFLRYYVEAMPRLSLHGQHFPPGHALHLHAANSLFGTTLLTAALAVLAAAAAGLVFAFLALREFLEERAARQGALLLAALPPFLDFACTAMDAVFFCWSSLALLAALRALRADARLSSALLAGAALGLAALSSFATLPLGLAIFVFALALALRRERKWSAMTRQVGVIGIGFVLFLGAFWLVTGFSWWECLLHARESGLALMTPVLKAPPSSRWAELTYGNAAAYTIAAGPGLAALLLARAAARDVAAHAPEDRSWAIAVLATLTVMTAGGLFFMETERIWLFTLPWIVAVAFSARSYDERSLRVTLAVTLATAFALELCLFTLW